MGKRTGSPLLAVAYIRASKEEQKLTADGQRASIEAWAAREGVQVSAWHIDQGVCSVTPVDERPALVAALASVKEHRAGVLVVAKRDRIARDVVISAMVGKAAKAAGAVIVSAAGEGNGSSPADEMMRGVCDVFSQYERSLIRSRTVAALAAKRAKNEKTGGLCPYGFELEADGIHLAPRADEQVIIRGVKELAASGFSQRSIVAECQARGWVSRVGRPLQLKQVQRMLAA
jgi:DNA invertase Pin-like site-specific DNA recombinase